MVFVSGGRCSPRVVVATAVSLALLVLSGLPAASSQLGTPVASPVPGESAGSLPPAWLEFAIDGRLVARVIVEGECPPLVVDGLDVGHDPSSAGIRCVPGGRV